jgi:predicted aspartyl protease
VQPVGEAQCELAGGTPKELVFAVCQIDFKGEITGARVLFAPSGAEPPLGVTAVESVGITVDPRTRVLERLAAIPLKRLRE